MFLNTNHTLGGIPSPQLRMKIVAHLEQPALTINSLTLRELRISKPLSMCTQHVFMLVLIFYIYTAKIS